MSERCYWAPDGKGGRMLIPGCMTAAHNPQLRKCLCAETAPSLRRMLVDAVSRAERDLAKARAELAEYEREERQDRGKR